MSNEVLKAFAETAPPKIKTIEAPPTQDEALQLMYKIHVELQQMYGARVRLDFRIKRLEDITSRVKFVKRARAHQLKFIGRLTSARRELKATLADINSFETEFRNLESNLNK